MKAKIHDVAREAGVSIKTVSRVLNNEPNVADATREKVKLAAKALNYSPSLAARSLAGSKTYLIAMLYGHASPEYIASIQRGAIEACRARGYHLMIEPLDAADAVTGEISDEVERSLKRMPVDGVILTPPLCDDQSVTAALRNLNIPYIPVAPSSPHEGRPLVQMDDEKAAFQMTEYLLSLGHKKIAFVKGIKTHSATPRRYDGYCRAMRAAGLTVSEDYIRCGDFNFESGLIAGKELLELQDRPTAIFASNDDMAAGVISAANHKGILVPEQLSVAGFDDTIIATILWPQLTTIRQPIHDMGFTAAGLLIDPQENYASEPHAHDLIVRASTAKCPS